MYITEREFILIVGIIAIIATYFITEWEFNEEEEIIETGEREFLNKSFKQMHKGETFKW